MCGFEVWAGTFYGNTNPKFVAGSEGTLALSHYIIHKLFYLFGFQGNKLKIYLRDEHETLEITYIFLQTLTFRADS